MIRLVVPTIRQFVTVIISNSMEQLLWFQRKQIVIRMRMIIQRLVRPQQRQQTEASNYQTLQDYNDAVANAASYLEKGARCPQPNHHCFRC